MPAEPFFFIQLSDPQLGAMAATGRIDASEGFAPASALFEEAVVEVNRLCPDFVVVTGDLGHNNMDTTEIAEVKRIAEGITASIPIYWLPGNRDTSFDGETAKSELLKRYRDEFGPDYHAFVHKEVAFICLSSTVIYDPCSIHVTGVRTRR